MSAVTWVSFIVYSSVNFVCWLLFGVRSTPMLPQWHVTDPGHYDKSAGGRLHLNMHTPLTQRSQSWLTMLLFRHSVGTHQEMSSHATCQTTLGHSRLSSPNHCGLILAYRVELVCPTKSPLKKKSAGGNELSNILPKSSHARIKPPPPPPP